MANETTDKNISVIDLEKAVNKVSCVVVQMLANQKQVFREHVYVYGHITEEENTHLSKLQT